MPTNSRNSKNARTDRPAVRWAATVAAAVWVFGVAIVFFARFSWVFYAANRPAIDEKIAQLAGMLGISR